MHLFQYCQIINIVNENNSKRVLLYTINKTTFNHTDVISSCLLVAGYLYLLSVLCTVKVLHVHEAYSGLFSTLKCA